MINTLQLFAAQDFLDAYFRYDVKSQCQVRNALQDMAKRFTAAPARVWTQYQQYKRFGREAKDNGLSGIIEVEVAGSVRLLAGVSAPKLYLLDLGQHDIEQRWDGIKTKSKWVKNRLANSKPANNLLFKGSANPFIRFSECKGWYKQYAAEDTSEWVVFLDRKQTEIVTSIIGEIKDHLHKNTWRDGLWLILGGPGTGKTVVLLKILQELLVETFSVGFSCSDAVYHYLKSATGCNIPRWNRESDSAHDVLLFDDPKDLEELANPPPRRPGQRARALVYAFDPLQLSRMPKSSELDGVIKRTKANEYELSICYRQREEIAKPVVNMTNVLAESNAYLEKNKVENFETDYSDLLRRFNNPEFQYHLGECKEYDPGSIGILNRRINELYEKSALWTHSPPFLFMIDRELESEHELLRQVRLNKDRFKIRWTDEVEDIKGVDYQHVIIILSEHTYTAVQEPFQGSGFGKFNDRRLLRIPFSRARDSLSLFVWHTPRDNGRS